MRLTAIALAALLPLGACSTVKEAVRGRRNLAPVGYPAALMPRNREVMSLASRPRGSAPRASPDRQFAVAHRA